MVAFKIGRLMSEIKKRECSLISMSSAIAGTKTEEKSR